MPNLPTLHPHPHGDKLRALVENEKLPAEDRPRVEQAIACYEAWLQQLKAVRGTYQEIIARMVSLLDDYKRYIEVDLVFDSDNDFLYRQKGQIKLDNTIIEEFLPILVTTALADQLQGYDLSFGPTTCFSISGLPSVCRRESPSWSVWPWATWFSSSSAF